MIGEQITLTKEEREIAKLIAERRIEAGNASGFYRGKMSDLDDLKMNYEGMMGEIAFCKLFNSYPDFEVKARRSKDDQGDCVYKGNKVDVKSTKYHRGKLLVTIWNHGNCDLFCLFTGEDGEYTFKGFCKKEDMLRKERIIDLGYGKTYAMNQNQLKEYEDL